MRLIDLDIGTTGCDVLLVSGGLDQVCATLGSGVVEAGRAMVSTGTAEVVEVAMDTPALAQALREGGISIYRHVVPGLYLAMTLNQSGDLLLRWFRDTLCRWKLEQAQATGQDPYDLILADVPTASALQNKNHRLNPSNSLKRKDLQRVEMGA